MNVSLLRYTANIQHNWLNSCVNWKRLVRLYAKWIDKKLTPEDAHSNKINLLLLLHALPNLDLNKHNALPPEAKIFQQNISPLCWRSKQTRVESRFIHFRQNNESKGSFVGKQFHKQWRRHTQNYHGHLLQYVVTLNLLHCPNFLTCINSFNNEAKNKKRKLNIGSARGLLDKITGLS